MKTTPCILCKQPATPERIIGLHLCKCCIGEIDERIRSGSKFARGWAETRSRYANSRRKHFGEDAWVAWLRTLGIHNIPRGDRSYGYLIQTVRTFRP